MEFKNPNFVEPGAPSGTGQLGSRRQRTGDVAMADAQAEPEASEKPEAPATNGGASAESEPAAEDKVDAAAMSPWAKRMPSTQHPMPPLRRRTPMLLRRSSKRRFRLKEAAAEDEGLSATPLEGGARFIAKKHLHEVIILILGVLRCSGEENRHGGVERAVYYLLRDISLRDRHRAQAQLRFAPTGPNVTGRSMST